MKANKSGFTLIELIMVIAILALISTLAVQKFGNMKIDSAKKLNMANLSRVSVAIDTFCAANDAKLNRLDNLFMKDTANGAEGSLDSVTSTSGMLAYQNETNKGLDGSLTNSFSMYGTAFPPILGTYYLSAADVAALSDLGLTYVMRGTVGASDHFKEDDAHEWIQDSNINDPDLISCVATTVTNGMAVAVVNPWGVVAASPLSPIAAYIYQACGQDVRFSVDQHVYVGGVQTTDGTDALTKLKAGEGMLLAFGLGQGASIVGSGNGGLESAPICPIMNRDTYRRYIILIRLRTNADGTVAAEYAGVVDSKGQTMKQLRAAEKK